MILVGCRGCESIIWTSGFYWSTPRRWSGSEHFANFCSSDSLYTSIHIYLHLSDPL